jgi:hypothetical protein
MIDMQLMFDGTLPSDADYSPLEAALESIAALSEIVVKGNVKGIYPCSCPTNHFAQLVR